MLGRLLHRKVGPTPTRLAAIDPRDGVNLGLLIAHHNEVVRALETAQNRLDILTGQQRESIGRIDELAGQPNSTMGDAWRSESDGLKLQIAVLEERVNNGRATAN